MSRLYHARRIGAHIVLDVYAPTGTATVHLNPKQALACADDLRQCATDPLAAKCETCHGTGARRQAVNGLRVTPPTGYEIVQRCLTCSRFATDLEAAESIDATTAHWQWTGPDTGPQAIVKSPPSDLGFFDERY